MKTTFKTYIESALFVTSIASTIAFLILSFQNPSPVNVYQYFALFTSLVSVITTGSIVELWFNRIIRSLELKSNSSFSKNKSSISHYLNDGKAYLSTCLFFFGTMSIYSLIIKNWAVWLIFMLVGSITITALSNKIRYFKSFVVRHLS